MGIGPALLLGGLGVFALTQLGGKKKTSLPLPTDPARPPPKLPPVPPPVKVKKNALEAELERMPKESRAHFRKMMKSRDITAIVNSAAVFKANGFPEASKALMNRAKKLEVARRKKEGDRVLTTDPAPPKPPRPAAPEMSVVLKEALANALRLLRIDPATGKVKCPVSKEAIQIATETSGRLRSAGFAAAADQLRVFAQQASKCRPTPPVDKQPPIPGIPAALREAIARALENERDIEKLQQLLKALESLPPSPERDILMASLRALIAQLRAKRDTDETVEEVDEIIKSPGLPQPTPAPTPAPTLPPPITLPKEPIPQRPPPPKTPLQLQAEATAKELLAAQARFGMPEAKKHFDVAKVQRLQGMLGETTDGKPGPKTFLAMARVGVSDVPIVMFWPRSATLSNVDAYRQDLLQLADAAAAAGRAQRATLLAQSANREKGQGGVVRVRAPLVRSVQTQSVERDLKSLPQATANTVNNILSSNDKPKLLAAATKLQSNFPKVAEFLRTQASSIKG